MRKTGRELLEDENAKKENYFSKLNQQNINALFMKKPVNTSSGMNLSQNNNKDKAGSEENFQIGGSTKGGPRIRGNQSSNLLINKQKGNNDSQTLINVERGSTKKSNVH